MLSGHEVKLNAVSSQLLFQIFPHLDEDGRISSPHFQRESTPWMKSLAILPCFSEFVNSLISAPLFLSLYQDSASILSVIIYKSICGFLGTLLDHICPNLAIKCQEQKYSFLWVSVRAGNNVTWCNIISAAFTLALWYQDACFVLLTNTQFAIVVPAIFLQEDFYILSL